MYLLDRTKDLGEMNDARVILVDRTTGKVSESVIRVASNFTNHVTIGNIFTVEDVLTYLLFATENVPSKYFSVGFGEVDNSTIIANDYIDKEINIRAKDILFSFKK